MALKSKYLRENGRQKGQFDIRPKSLVHRKFPPAAEGSSRFPEAHQGILRVLLIRVEEIHHDGVRAVLDQLIPLRVEDRAQFGGDEVPEVQAVWTSLHMLLYCFGLLVMSTTAAAQVGAPNASRRGTHRNHCLSRSSFSRSEYTRKHSCTHRMTICSLESSSSCFACITPWNTLDMSRRLNGARCPVEPALKGGGCT